MLLFLLGAEHKAYDPWVIWAAARGTRRWGHPVWSKIKATGDSISAISFVSLWGWKLGLTQALEGPYGAYHTRFPSSSQASVSHSTCHSSQDPHCRGSFHPLGVSIKLARNTLSLERESSVPSLGFLLFLKPPVTLIRLYCFPPGLYSAPGSFHFFLVQGSPLSHPNANCQTFHGLPSFVSCLHSKT